jgi:hypothetical protein
MHACIYAITTTPYKVARTFSVTDCSFFFLTGSFTMSPIYDCKQKESQRRNEVTNVSKAKERENIQIETPREEYNLEVKFNLPRQHNS